MEHESDAKFIKIAIEICNVINKYIPAKHHIVTVESLQAENERLQQLLKEKEEELARFVQLSVCPTVNTPTSQYEIFYRETRR